MSDIIYMTKEKYLELEKELHQLKGKGRQEMAMKIAEARSHGDLSENADYDAAKDAQGLMELKIGKISTILSKTQVINSSEFPDDKVYILSKVKLLNVDTGKEIFYQLVSPEEADYEQQKIAVTSPVGKSLMGKKIGEMAEINVPAGRTVYEILDITK